MKYSNNFPRASCRSETISDDNLAEHNIAVSSANMDITQFPIVGISAVYMLYSTGDKQDPCGHPAFMLNKLECVDPMCTLKDLHLRNFVQFL